MTVFVLKQNWADYSTQLLDSQMSRCYRGNCRAIVLEGTGMLRALLFVFAVLIFSCSSVEAEFVDGHIYSTKSFIPGIQVNDENGAPLGTLSVALDFSTQRLEGVVFGPDNLAYAVVDVLDNSQLDRVVAISADGQIVRSYEGVNNDGFLKTIEFDNQGRFYVSGSGGIQRFDSVNSTTANPFYSGRPSDIAFSGNESLFVADRSFDQVVEVDLDGNLVRAIEILDPSGLLGGDTPRFITGVAYDSTNSVLYASADFRTLKIDAVTGNLLAATNVSEGADLFFDDVSGRLIAGRFDDEGIIFDRDLNLVSVFQGNSENSYVTVFRAVPEPSGAFVGFVALLLCATKRRKTS